MGRDNQSSHGVTSYIICWAASKWLNVDVSITRSWTLIPGASRWEDSVRRHNGGGDAGSSSVATVDREAAAAVKRQRRLLPPPLPGDPSLSAVAPSRPILPICELPQFLRDCAMEESDNLAGQAVSVVESDALAECCFEFDFCGVVLGSSAVHTPDGK